MAEAAAGIERAERHLRMLALASDIALRLTESAGRRADARFEAVIADPGVFKPGEDPAAPFSKIAQTLRRTIALEAWLAAGVKAQRESLVGERTRRRAERDAAHKAAMDQAIGMALGGAFHEGNPDADFEKSDAC